MIMGNYTAKDGWNYCDDGTQRWRKRKDGSVEVESVPVGESMTKQEFAEDCDVNVILKRFLKTGEMPKIVNKSGVYGDFTSIPSYQEAIDTMIRAETAFMALPAEVRQRFANNPQQLMDYLANPENDDDAVKMGLKVRPAPVVKDPVLEQLEAIAANTKSADAK